MTSIIISIVCLISGVSMTTLLLTLKNKRPYYWTVAFIMNVVSAIWNICSIIELYNSK